MNIIKFLRAIILMASSLTCCAIALGESSNPEFFEAAQSIKKRLVEMGCETVAVSPRFAMILDRDDQSMVANLARNAERAMADSLRHALQRECGRGTPKIAVLSDPKSMDRLDKIEPDDIAELQKAARELRIGAIVFGSLLRSGKPGTFTPVFGHDGAFEVECHVVDGRSGEIGTGVRTAFALSIAGAAYFGDSFELRRWHANTLLNVGIHCPASSTDWIKSTDRSTRGEFSNVCRDKPHPLADPDCGFRMRILVDGKERPMRFIGNKPYAVLNPGESYVVNLINDTLQDVCLAVFVDGVNALGKNVEHPGNCRYWHFEGKSESNIRGWYTDTPTKDKFDCQSFTIGAAQSGPAVQQGNIARLGQITAVMYSCGAVEMAQQRVQVKDYFFEQRKAQRIRLSNGDVIVSKPPDAIQQKYVTIAGPSSVVAKKLVKTAPPDLVLAAITVRYDTSAAIDQAESLEMAAVGKASGFGLPSDPIESRLGCPMDSQLSSIDRSGIAVRANIVDGRADGVLVTKVVDNSPGTFLYDRYAKRYKLVPGRDVIMVIENVGINSKEEFDQQIMAAGVRKVNILVKDLATGEFGEYRMWLR